MMKLDSWFSGAQATAFGIILVLLACDTTSEIPKATEGGPPSPPSATGAGGAQSTGPAKTCGYPLMSGRGLGDIRIGKVLDPVAAGIQVGAVPCGGTVKLGWDCIH